MMKRGISALMAAAAVLGLTGCGAPYTGINSLPLPGTKGTGAGSYTIKVQLRNADALVANTPVFVDDINVGTTTLVALENGWTPTLTLSIQEGVKLPANATAALAQTSLLGSKHIELSAPAGVPPQGTLAPGALIREDRVKQFPETEDLLSGVSALLNGGGLEHFETITTELNRALGNGRDKDARELLTQLNVFTAGLDSQTNDIVFALKGFDNLGATLAPRLADIDKALQQLPAGLDTVNDLEPKIVETLGKLGDSTEKIAPFADEGSDQLRKVFDELESPLRKIGDVQAGTLPRALRQLPFLIFTPDSLPWVVRGDYANLQIPVNLTLESLDANLFTGTPASGSLYSVAKAAQGGGPGVPGAPTGPVFPSVPRVPGLPSSPIAGPSGTTPADRGPSLPSLPKLGK